jgi:hypothetical protein
MSRVIKIALVAVAVLVALPPACTFASRVYAVVSRDAFLRGAQLVQNTLPLPGGAIVETYGAEIYDTTPRPTPELRLSREISRPGGARGVCRKLAGKPEQGDGVCVGSLVVVIPEED